jgi:hypothetical protein
MGLLRRIVLAAIALSAALSCLNVASACGDPGSKDKKPSTTPAHGTGKKTETPTTFTGQVIKVIVHGDGKGGIVWVKHANGLGEPFHVHADTKFTGVTALNAITKGSMVVVESTKKRAVSINVTKVAPPAPPDRTQGGPVKGTIVEVHSDSYGDTGHISVKTASGAVKKFQVTNATVVQRPHHKDFVHTLEFVHDGDAVSVEHDLGKIALLISITATPSK